MKKIHIYINVVILVMYDRSCLFIIIKLSEGRRSTCLSCAAGGVGGVILLLLF